MVEKAQLDAAKQYAQSLIEDELLDAIINGDMEKQNFWADVTVQSPDTTMSSRGYEVAVAIFRDCFSR